MTGSQLFDLRQLITRTLYPKLCWCMSGNIDIIFADDGEKLGFYWYVIFHVHIAEVGKEIPLQIIWCLG